MALFVKQSVLMSRRCDVETSLPRLSILSKQNDSQSEQMLEQLKASVNLNDFPCTNPEQTTHNIMTLKNLLLHGYSIIDIPDHVISTCLELASQSDAPPAIIEAVVEIISHISLLEDRRCCECITPDIINFLGRVITQYGGVNGLIDAYGTFMYLTACNGREETLLKLKELECFNETCLIQSAISVVSNAEQFTPESHVTQCIHLLSNCFVWDIEPAGKVAIVTALSQLYDTTEHFEWKCDVIYAFDCMIRWCRDDFGNFMDDEMISRFVTAASPVDEKLAFYGFVAITKLADWKSEFADQVICHNYFSFECPDDWQDSAMIQYLHSVSTLVSKSSSADPTILEHVVETLIPRMARSMHIWEDFPFDVKEAIVGVLCNILNINNSLVTRFLVEGNWHIVRYLCEVFVGTDETTMLSILDAFMELCDHGEKISMDRMLIGCDISECANPFLVEFAQAEIDLSDIDVSESDDLAVKIDRFKKEMEKAEECFEIDFAE